ncbi:MAG: endonuclease III [Legionellaceae bacterium]|nr:endonuclease III [Legionellaceae bacterium]
MNTETCQKIFERFKAENPEPETELQYTTPFELLIAVMLSAQSTDKSVNKVTGPLFAKANTPEQLLALGEDTLAFALRSLNYYKTKARHILKTCAILIAEHHSQVPATRAALEALPGVGRKTANVVLSIAFNQATLAVDTHIFRVANRTGLAQGKTPLAVEQQLMQVIPSEYIQEAHHWLILHGRYICIAKKPRCQACLIQDLCEYGFKEGGS